MIYIITHKLKGGGAEVAVASLSNFLYSQKVSHKVISLQNCLLQKRLGDVEILSPKFSKIRLRRIVLILFWLVKFFQNVDHKKDRLVVFQTDLCILLVLLSLLMKRTAGFLRVCERSDPQLYPPSKFLRGARNFLYDYSGGIICQTEYAKSYFLGHGLKCNLNVCRNISKTSMFSSRVSNDFGGFQFSLLSVGRLVESKRLDLALDFMHVLKELHIGALLRIVGDGPSRSLLACRAKEMGLETCIDFVGEVNDVDKFYRCSSLLLHPSELEGSPNVVIEAFQHGVPCIGNKFCKPMQELIFEKSTGFLLEDFSDTSSIKTIVNQLRQPMIYSKMSANCINMSLSFSGDIAGRSWVNAIF